ncbi:MAG: sulfite exporter TauE/SafE family protein [Thermodesulfobacteriota bacterium]
MEFDQLFLLTIQSSFVLGIVHGINPCGHSWLVLAPFVSGTRRGRRVAFLTFSFLAGTALACLLLGATLGAISVTIPPGISNWVENITSGILILLGIIMVAKPHILHHHDHDHHDHSHCHQGKCAGDRKPIMSRKKTTGATLFGIGFVNMIIPCPTVAIMYSFALESGSYLKSATVFGVYAFSTSLAVGAVIYGIFRVTSLVRTLSQDWIEGAIMRTIGVLTVFFGAYSIYLSG